MANVRLWNVQVLSVSVYVCVGLCVCVYDCVGGAALVVALQVHGQAIEVHNNNNNNSGSRRQLQQHAKFFAAQLHVACTNEQLGLAALVPLNSSISIIFCTYTINLS